MRLLLYIISLIAVVTSSACAFEIPALKSHVNDYAGVLSEQTTSTIKHASASLEKKEGTQVVVLTVKDMGDAADIKEYANKVFVSWGLGQKDVDNGVLIVLALKERMVRIEVGKGLEEYLTDAGTSQIIRSARDSLSKEDYNSGLLQISQEVQKVVYGKFAPSPAVEPQQAQPHKSAPWAEKAIRALYDALSFIILGFPVIWALWDFIDKRKKTDSNRASTKRNRAAMGITAAAAVATASIATSSKRGSDDHYNQESSWSPSYDSSSSSSSSSDCCSGGGGDSGGGGSDSSF